MNGEQSNNFRFSLSRRTMSLVGSHSMRQNVRNKWKVTNFTRQPERRWFHHSNLCSYCLSVMRRISRVHIADIYVLFGWSDGSFFRSLSRSLSRPVSLNVAVLLLVVQFFFRLLCFVAVVIALHWIYQQRSQQAHTHRVSVGVQCDECCAYFASASLFIMCASDMRTKCMCYVQSKKVNR